MHDNDVLDQRMARRRAAAGPLPAPRDLFDAWRAPRGGDANPTRMDNPVWAWLIRTRISAYEAADHYEAHSAVAHGPTWCFDRFGQSTTQLPDGRTIFVGGEHEDYYDPDFHIYNDVVVIDADGEIAIHGYPRTVFPPTDFHTASLIGSDVYIIGRLGYPEDRRSRIEAVHVLDADSYRIRTVETSGDPPPWLHRHVAEVDPVRRSIRISGGYCGGQDLPVLVENLGIWELQIDSGTWTHVGRRAWSRWCFQRTEPAQNALWAIRQMLWSASVGWTEDHVRDRAGLEPRLGADAQPESIISLYAPPVRHTAIENAEEEYNVHRISIDDVIVRYVEEWAAVSMTIEGALHEDIIENLVEDLLAKLSKIEGHAYRVDRIPD